MAAIYMPTEPTVVYSQDGSVHVQAGDDHWLVFRTEAHWTNWRELADREQISHDLSAIDRFRDCEPLEEWAG